MALLNAVCAQMGLHKVDTSTLDNQLNSLPQNWNNFQSMDSGQHQECKSTILKQLNIDPDTMNTIWFRMHYLALYEHFNVREGVPFECNETVVHAFATLVACHSSVVKHHTNEVRIEWTDIQQSLKIRKSGRPQSPWGVIPSLSIPTDPAPFVDHIWPQCPLARFPLLLPDAVRQEVRKQYGNKSTDVLIAIYLKTLDLAAIVIYGLQRIDESDRRLIRHYQKHGNVFASNGQGNDNKHPNDGKHCNLKLCVSYHRTCMLLHLHGRWAENVLAIETQQSEQKEVEKDNRSSGLQKYVALYFGKGFSAETVWSDIRHIQQKHIDVWVHTNVEQLLSQRPKISYRDDDDQDQSDEKSNEAEVFESMERYQDVKQFVLDMNDTKDIFCGEFVCDVLRSSDAPQAAKDEPSTKQNDKNSTKHPSLLPMMSTADASDLYELCVALHQNIFHGASSLCQLLTKYAVKAAKLNPEKERKLRAAIRADIQKALRKYNI